MEYQTIVNPTTNRRVSIHGRLGRRILRNYLAQWQRGGGDQDEVTETGKEGNTWEYKNDHTAETFCNKINNHTAGWVNRRVNIIHAKDGAEALLQNEARIITTEDADGPCIVTDDTPSITFVEGEDVATEKLEPGMKIQLLTEDSTDD